VPKGTVFFFHLKPSLEKNFSVEKKKGNFGDDESENFAYTFF
jgi:hypothetical protein